MVRDYRLYIYEIWESILKIEEYTVHLKEEEFYKSELVQDAVSKRLEVIGESVKHLPEEFTQKYPQIPWRELAGLRDIIAHTYFKIDFKRIWINIKNDIPKIKYDFKLIMEESNSP